MKKGFKFTTELNVVCKDCFLVFKCFSVQATMCESCRKSSEFRTNMLIPTWRLRRLVSMAKNRATLKNLDFNITTDYLYELWVKNTGCCEITNRIFDLTPFGKKGQVNPNAPSVDRIVPSLGYVKGNVRLVTYHVNVALAEFGLGSLIKLSEDVIDFNKDTHGTQSP